MLKILLPQRGGKKGCHPPVGKELSPAVHPVCGSGDGDVEKAHAEIGGGYYPDSPVLGTGKIVENIPGHQEAGYLIAAGLEHEVILPYGGVHRFEIGTRLHRHRHISRIDGEFPGLGYCQPRGAGRQASGQQTQKQEEPH